MQHLFFEHFFFIFTLVILASSAEKKPFIDKTTSNAEPKKTNKTENKELTHSNIVKKLTKEEIKTGE